MLSPQVQFGIVYTFVLFATVLFLLVRWLDRGVLSSGGRAVASLMVVLGLVSSRLLTGQLVNYIKRTPPKIHSVVLVESQTDLHDKFHLRSRI